MFCRIYQWHIENQVDCDGAIGPRAKKHLRKCGACRTFYHQFARLDAELKASASHPLSDVYLQEISDSVLQRFSENPKPSVSRSFGPRQTLGTGWKSVAAVFIAAVLLTTGYQWVQHSGRGGMDDLHLNPQSFFEGSYNTLVALPEKSILSEFQKLSRDTRNASVFLMNCVPALPAQPPSSTVREAN